MAEAAGQPPLRVAILAGEHSGDALGRRLMRELKAIAGRQVVFMGVGGPLMAEEGLVSLYPMSEFALMGPFVIMRRLPRLVRLIRRIVGAVVDFAPDVLVLVDSPEFTHAVGKRVRRRIAVPVANYVSPTVWAWRPWRARAMRAYIDTVIAVFPFEPQVHARLGGPACVYVGHPAVERLDEVLPPHEEGAGPPVLLLLPGSRSSEVDRLLPIFRGGLERLAVRGHEFRPVLPAVSHLARSIEDAVANWPVKPTVVTGEAAKWEAFASARAALAASGTVTLELALAGIPMVVAYRLDPLVASLKWMYRGHSVVMANLILGENAFPEFIHHGCTPQALADAVEPLLGETPERAAQIDAIERLGRLAAPQGDTPSRRAAAAVLATAAGQSSIAG